MPEQEPEKKSRGGISISGDARIHFDGDMVSGDKIVQGDEYHVGGDLNRIEIGAGAQVGQVAAGRNISQINQPSPAEKNELAEKLAQLTQALQAVSAQLDASKFELAKYQLEQFQEELLNASATPNVKTLLRAADGLKNNVPLLGGPLGAVFQTAAAQKMLAQAGASDWANERFK